MTPKEKKRDPTKRATWRIPTTLYDHIQQRATYNGNTMNAEVVARLEATAEGDRFDQLSREIAEVRALLLDALAKR